MKEVKENLSLSSLLDYTCMYITQNIRKSFEVLCSAEQSFAARDRKLWFTSLVV